MNRPTHVPFVRPSHVVDLTHIFEGRAPAPPAGRGERTLQGARSVPFDASNAPAELMRTSFTFFLQIGIAQVGVERISRGNLALLFARSYAGEGSQRCVDKDPPCAWTELCCRVCSKEGTLPLFSWFLPAVLGKRFFLTQIRKVDDLKSSRDFRLRLETELRLLLGFQKNRAIV